MSGHIFCLRIRRPPISTQSRSSAASDVYKRQLDLGLAQSAPTARWGEQPLAVVRDNGRWFALFGLSLIHISEPTRLLSNSYAVFCLKKKNKAAPNITSG